MKHVGVRKTVMLSGDQKEIVEKVAGELGIDEYHAQLLPADKVDRVEKLLEQKNEKDKVAFVGDGINDAPVLTRADIGIAMGSMGSDAAIEAADVVLMDDDVTKIASVVKISGKTLSIKSNTSQNSMVTVNKIGQAGYEVLNEYFAEIYGKEIKSQRDIKKLFLKHIGELIQIYLNEAFSADYVVYVKKVINQ